MRLCFKLLGCSVVVAVAFAGDVPMQHITSRVTADARTGKLVRSVVITPKVIAARPVEPATVEEATKATAPPTGINEAVDQIAAQHSLSPSLIHSVIKVESNYNPFAVSPKGAQGLMQLIPQTARRFGVNDVFNPMQNIEGGAKYLRYLLDLYHENLPLALAAYNAGEGAVAKYGTVPPYSETQNYLLLVANQLRKSKTKAEAPAQTAKKPAETTGTPEPNHIQKVVEADGSVRFVTR